MKKYSIYGELRPIRDDGYPEHLRALTPHPYSVYQAQDVENELARLRERVVELEKELQQTDAAYLADNSALREHSKLLLEAVRWCLTNGVQLGKAFNGGEPRPALFQPGNCCAIEAPEHLREILAPLIAEAVQTEVRR